LFLGGTVVKDEGRGTRGEEKKERGTGPRPREIRYEVRDARCEGKGVARNGTETEDGSCEERDRDRGKLGTRFVMRGAREK